MVVVARVYRKYCTYQFTVSRWSLMAADTVSCASSFAISCRAERQCEMGWAGLGWGGGLGRHFRGARLLASKRVARNYLQLSPTPL